MPDVLPEVEAGDGEDERVLGGLQQPDEELKHLVVAVVQPVGVLAPELLGAVDGGPLQAAGVDLSHVLVVGAE